MKFNVSPINDVPECYSSAVNEGMSYIGCYLLYPVGGIFAGEIFSFLNKNPHIFAIGKGLVIIF